MNPKAAKMIARLRAKKALATPASAPLTDARISRAFDIAAKVVPGIVLLTAEDWA